MSKWGKFNRARARKAPGSLTQPEAARARYLWALQAEGRILHHQAKPLKLRLARASFYEPDFLVIALTGEVILEEVKGRMGWSLDDEGRTKWKVAGELFPYFVLRGAVLTEAGWQEETYDPVQPFPMPGSGEPAPQPSL